MIIEFDKSEFYDYYVGKYSGKTPFSEMVLSSYRDKLNIFKSASSLDILSKMRSLNIEKYKKHWSARINDQFRIEFDYIKPNTIVILKISKHYE